jgi:hypothetical protein
VEKITMIGLTEIATAAVIYLTPYLAEAGKEAAKKDGGTAADRVVKLYDALKAKLTHPFAQQALADLEKTPEDADTQATFRSQLKKALAEDPQLLAELGSLMTEIERETGGVRQNIAITGDENVGVQIAGSRNTVELPGKRA